MRPSIAQVQPLASCSRQVVRRAYATAPSTNPHLASPADSRTETIRRVLYPADAYSPNSASPTGSYHPDHKARLAHLIPDAEVYETIDRAWKLHQREKRAERQRALAIKLKAMEEACDELDRLTSGSATATAPTGAGAQIGAPEAGEGGEGEGAGGVLPRVVYDRAMSRPSLKGEKVKIDPSATATGGRKETPETRWAAARIEGLVPREAWVPTETRGRGWNYDWTRPGK